MTIDEATNVTIEDAINTFERLVFSQDFCPATLRGKAICKIALKALRAQRQENKTLTLEKQLAEAKATADHEHYRYIKTLGERDEMEARCAIAEAERDKYKASLDQIENLVVGFMESGPYESEVLEGLWLANRVLSLCEKPLEAQNNE